MKYGKSWKVIEDKPVYGDDDEKYINIKYVQAVWLQIFITK